MRSSGSSPPQNSSPRQVSGPASLLRIWFGVRDEVPQRLYALSGISLMLFKYAAEAERRHIARKQSLFHR